MGAEETTCPNEQTRREDCNVDMFVSHLNDKVQEAMLCCKYSHGYRHFKHEYPDCIHIMYTTVQKFGFSNIYI